LDRTILAVAAGGLWGLAVALLNTAITRRALKKDSINALMGAVAVRTVLDAAALLAVYLLRHVLPLPFAPTIIAAAVGLSMGVIALAVLLQRRRDAGHEEDKTGGE